MLSLHSQFAFRPFHVLEVSCLEMEPVADLAGDLVRIVEVRSAKDIRIVQQIASVRDVLCGKSDRKPLPYRFGNRKRNFRMVGKMERAVAIQKSRAVGKIAGS